jgi:hypothetical protein
LSQVNISSGDFKPFSVRTNNIAKELVSTASKYGIKASALDFNLLESQTFLSREEGKEEEVIGEEFEALNDEALLADPNVRIRQTYEIEIVLADKEDKFINLAVSIGANPSMTRLFAAVKPGSVLEYYEGIERDLLEFINKRKLRANMLIGVWDKKLREEIDKFVAKVQVAGKMTFEEKTTIEVGHSLDSVPTVDDKLILHYKKHDDQGEKGKVDHSKRGFIQGVLENDLLIEYIKPVKGKAGRNCRGEFIEPSEPIVANTPAFNVSEKIEVLEKEDSIEYRAKNSGYIVFENNTYDIQGEVEVTEISFKTTGSIEAGVNTDISINVKEKDAFKDAIGAGMEVEVNEINVDGNVGSNAKIKAKKVKIEGQTHQTSYIEADEVKVNIHKGKIKGQKVEVTRLEQGVIEGEYVEVFQATGGKIIAKEVVIDTLSSHVDIIASSKIEIKNFKGEENTLTISPIVYEEDKEALKGNEEEIKAQKRKIRSLQEEVDKKQAFLNDNAAAIADLKKRLAHYKQSGTKMPVSFVTKFKEFQELQVHLLSLKQELKQKEKTCELLKDEHQTFQADILESKIINHDQYRGHNEIRFKLIDPDLELYLVPRGGPNEKCFMLRENEEDESYSIVSTEIEGKA